MCHGLPRQHPCSHSSVTWHYCPSALIDLETGYETQCGNVSFAATQDTDADCPLQYCTFKEMGGMWTCCNCHQGPNSYGWCNMPLPLQRVGLNGKSLALESVSTTCDHGCCDRCHRYPYADAGSNSDSDYAQTMAGPSSPSSESSSSSSSSGTGSSKKSSSRASSRGTSSKGSSSGHGKSRR